MQFRSRNYDAYYEFGNGQRIVLTLLLTIWFYVIYEQMSKTCPPKIHNELSNVYCIYNLAWVLL